MKKQNYKTRAFFIDAAKVTAITFAVILILEVVLRLAAFGWYHSEYYLFYGIHNWIGRVGINPWSTVHGEYYKFPPNYILKSAAGQGAESASINSHGFRGPDFETVKPKGVFRVIWLGESSTFGYHDHDDETYPFILGRLFAKEELPVEVINAGFPYYNSGSILGLLKNEIVMYKPDLITLYAGFNDTGWPFHIGPLARMALWLQSHSVTYLLLRDNFNALGQSEGIVLNKLIPQPDRDQLKRESEIIAKRYREDVLSIVRLAKSQDIPVVLIKQPVTTHDRNYLSMTYEQENRSILEKFERGESLSLIQILMLKQHRLMEELGDIASEYELPLVDNTKIVDQDRRRLASWVHLTNEANLRLAEALEPVIKAYVVRAQASSKRGVPKPLFHPLSAGRELMRPGG